MKETRGPGRPREAETDERILDATYRLMAQHGYNRMSIDMVATEACVSKPTIYRRYTSKVDLAVAALVRFRDREPTPRCGDTRSDLIAELCDFRQGLGRPYGMAMVGTVLSEEFDTPELLQSFREHLVMPRRRAFRSILAEAQSRGEITEDAPIEIAITMMVGSYYAHYLAGGVFPDDWEIQTADATLRALNYQSR